MTRTRKVIQITPELLAEIESALDEGMSYKHVGEVVGVPRQFVARHFPGRGWDKKQITQHGAAVRQFNWKMRNQNV